MTELRDGRQDVDFYGVVTFEVEFNEVVGMGYSNVLIKHSNRIVLEAKTIIKKSFETLDDFFNFYYPNDDIE